MERDFMGLSSKQPLAVVKEEIPDAIMDSGSGVPWPFMNKGSALPHFMPFKAGQDDRTKKMASVPASSPGFTPVNSAAEIQSNSFSNPSLANSGQNLVGTALKQQFLAGVPLAVPSSVGPIVGVTEPWYNFKASTARGQMTIFYAGTVNVYDDISPEKAQAIMLLAGNGSSICLNQSPQQVQAPSPKPVVATSDLVSNQPINSQPNTDPPAHTGPGSASNSNDETVANKTSGVSTAPVGKPEPQRIVSSLSPIPLTTMIPSAVPLARKASLARFLEKRKERVMSIAPYSCENRPRESRGVENNEASLSATSVTTAGSASAGRES
ncbi:hypothetical protein Dimus_014593 [Dionaea muscipula]